MPEFAASLSAREVDDRLRGSLRELKQAERNCVLWFSDLMKRRLYLELGFSSIYQYASERLGFSESKTAQFVRLSKSLAELPRLRASVARGEVSWTKAREVVKVATRRNEKSASWTGACDVGLESGILAADICAWCYLPTARRYTTRSSTGISGHERSLFRR